MARRMGDDDRPVQARSRAPLTNDGAIDMWLEMYSWPLIDLSDPDAINQRLAEYLDLCKRYNSKPEVSGWCQTIGTTRIEVLDWSKGKRTRLDDVLTTGATVASCANEIATAGEVKISVLTLGLAGKHYASLLPEDEVLPKQSICL